MLTLSVNDFIASLTRREHMHGPAEPSEPDTDADGLSAPIARGRVRGFGSGLIIQLNHTDEMKLMKITAADIM